MLKVGQRGEESDGGTAGFRSLIDEIVRDGARKMLAAALQAEVAAYVKQFADQVDEDGRRLVVRNGYHQPRTVVTSAGAVEVKALRMNDKRTDPETGERQRFSSAILPAWARRSPQITEVLPLLYLHGLSSGDFAPALEQFLGTGAGLSASSITRLTTQWQDDARAFAARDLSGVDYVYLWADRIHLKIRLEQEKLCLLVMIGVRADGRKELVALTDGFRESHESWADLLRDCRRRGPDPRGRRRCAGLLESATRRLPADEGAALLVPQAGECPCCASEVGTSGRAGGDEGNLQRRGRRQGAGGDHRVRTRLRREVPEGRREDRRRRRRAAGVLPLPGGALDPSAHDEPHRIYFRDSAFEEQGHQGAGLAGGRARDGVQADRGR
jgi:putative transposase